MDITRPSPATWPEGAFNSVFLGRRGSSCWPAKSASG